MSRSGESWSAQAERYASRSRTRVCLRAVQGGDQIEERMSDAGVGPVEQHRRRGQLRLGGHVVHVQVTVQQRHRHRSGGQLFAQRHESWQHQPAARPSPPPSAMSPDRGRAAVRSHRGREPRRRLLRQPAGCPIVQAHGPQCGEPLGRDRLESGEVGQHLRLDLDRCVPAEPIGPRSSSSTQRRSSSQASGAGTEAGNQSASCAMTAPSSVNNDEPAEALSQTGPAVVGARSTLDSSQHRCCSTRPVTDRPRAAN